MPSIWEFLINVFLDKKLLWGNILALLSDGNSIYYIIYCYNNERHSWILPKMHWILIVIGRLLIIKVWSPSIYISNVKSNWYLIVKVFEVCWQWMRNSLNKQFHVRFIQKSSPYYNINHMNFYFSLLLFNKILIWDVLVYLQFACVDMKANSFIHNHCVTN